MRIALMLLVIVAVLASPHSMASSRLSGPNLDQLKLVAQLPPELPQRVTGFAYDGEKFWVAIYLGRGRNATLNPLTLGWTISDNNDHHKPIKEVSGAFESPGGICFVNRTLWIGASYGNSFGSIDTQTWKVEHLFKVKQRDDSANQSYAAIAFDGNYLWMAWHWVRYDLPVSQTQLLLKVDPQTGTVIGEYPLPAGSPSDLTHGLTWDGTNLWHIKDSRLSSIDPSTGAVTAQYVLDQVKRASGLAWDGHALWIAEFDGKIWRLPF